MLIAYEYELATCHLRRRFIATTAAALVAPQVLTAQKSEKQLVIGEGAHRYEVLHNWPQLPDRFSWQITHNVAIDREGLLYVIHEGRENLKEHPSIFVFDPKGKFVRAFGSQFQGVAMAWRSLPKARSNSSTLPVISS